ncbi:putative zinc ribbon protein, partial [Escherichia coli]
DQMTVAEKILLRCTWLDPAEKEARRLHLQGMTVPDYTVKVRKWFCVMCDEDYEGEKCCPSCGTGVYSREGGLQEGNWKDRN